MKCNKCNKIVSNSDKFCTYCGIQMKKEDLSLEELNVQYRNIKDDLRDIKEKISILSGSKSKNKYPNSVISSMSIDKEQKIFRLPNLEEYLGGNWLVRIGVFALILGVSLFI